MCLAPRSGRSHSVWRQMMKQQQELLKSLTSHRPFVIAGIIKHMARPTKIRVENKICHVGSELAGPWYVTFRRVTHFSIFYYFQESENDIRDLFHSSFFSNYSFSVLLSIVEMQQVRHPVSTKKYKKRVWMGNQSWRQCDQNLNSQNRIPVWRRTNLFYILFRCFQKVFRLQLVGFL